MSPAYETLWDRTCAGLYERPLSWLEPVHADDRQRVRETFLRRSGAGLAFEIEFRVLRTDGSPRWILLRGFPIRKGWSTRSMR